MPITILLTLVPVIPTGLAWTKWIAADQHLLGRRRKIAFSLGLCTATVSLLEYAAFVAYAMHIGGFGTNFPALLLWTRPGFWISVAALLLALAGGGKSRAFGAISGALLVILWAIPDWGI
jgi:hypothetical protein